MNTLQLFTEEELKDLIREIVKEEISQYSEKPFMTLEEASHYLGIKRATLYAYNNKHKISYQKVGSKIYYKKEVLDNFVMNDKNRIRSEEEIEKEVETYLICSQL